MADLTDYETWLKAIVARPHDAATRSAFLDWLQETDPDRCGGDNYWWRNFSRPDGAWAVVAEYAAGPAVLWTVLAWSDWPGLVGLGMARGWAGPRCGRCGDDAPWRRVVEGDGWVCGRCVPARREPFDLYRTARYIPDGVPPAYDDIPF